VANTFIKPEVVNRTALALLEREIVLPRLVWSYSDAEFRGAKDDTVTVRLPAVATAREYAWRNNRSSAITVDDLTETSVPVLLNHDLYHAAALTDEQLTLDIVDFGEQVLMPQVKGVARGLENLIAAEMLAADYASQLNLRDSANNLWPILVEARRLLNVAEVPRDGRILLVGADVEAELLTDDRFIRADSTGDSLASDALQNATIGRLAGFTIVGSNAIDAETAIAFHPTAFAFVNVAPVIPDGVTAGARQAYGGLAMRWIRDYDPTKLQDRSVVSSFGGCTSVEDGANSKNVRAVRINFQGDS
jgi:hypothetical protein